MTTSSPRSKAVPLPVTDENIRAAVRTVAARGQGTERSVTVTDIYRELHIPHAVRNTRRDSQYISRTFRDMGLIPLAKRGEQRRRYLITETADLN